MDRQANSRKTMSEPIKVSKLPEWVFVDPPQLDSLLAAGFEIVTHPSINVSEIKGRRFYIKEAKMDIEKIDQFVDEAEQQRREIRTIDLQNSVVSGLDLTLGEALVIIEDLKNEALSKTEFQIGDKVMVKCFEYDHDWKNLIHTPKRDSDGNIMFHFEPGIIRDEAYVVETLLPKDSDPCCSNMQCLDKSILREPNEEELRDWEKIVEGNG